MGTSRCQLHAIWTIDHQDGLEECLAPRHLVSGPPRVYALSCADPSRQITKEKDTWLSDVLLAFL